MHMSVITGGNCIVLSRSVFFRIMWHLLSCRCHMSKRRWYGILLAFTQGKLQRNKKED